jgi:hypothetical protein
MALDTIVQQAGNLFQQAAPFIEPHRYEILSGAAGLFVISSAVTTALDGKPDKLSVLTDIANKSWPACVCLLTVVSFAFMDNAKLGEHVENVSYNKAPTHIKEDLRDLLTPLGNDFLSDLQLKKMHVKLHTLKTETTGAILQITDTDKNSLFLINFSHKLDVSRQEIRALWDAAKKNDFKQGFYQIKDIAELATGKNLTVDFQEFCNQTEAKDKNSLPCVLPLSLSQ